MNTTARAILIGAAVAVVLVLVLGPLLMIAMMLGMGGMMGQPGVMMGPGGLMMLLGLLVAVGIILLLVWGLRRLADQGTSLEQQTPLTILQRRYARGEIGA